MPNAELACDETPPPSLEKLPFPAQFMIWAARQWIYEPLGPTPSSLRLAEAFTNIGLPQAIWDFNAALCVLARCARRTLDFRPPSDLMVAADEQLLIALVGALQSNCRGCTDFVCDQWLTPSERGLLLAPLQRLSNSLMHVGLDLTSTMEMSATRSASVDPRRSARTSQVVLH